MCCFSGPVEHVGGTHIFARASLDGRQFIAYQMAYESKSPVAMILPIPVTKGSGEKAVRFINLEKFPNFFDYLSSHFPASKSRTAPQPMSKSASRAKLEVVQVGSFVASFVPTLADFSRVDPQFKIKDQIWESLPLYRNFGFAVFQLKPGRQKVHPMAFDYPCALTHRLFFPTLHIHDGAVHAEAEFDHELYAQRLNSENLRGWTESHGPLLPYYAEEDAFFKQNGLAPQKLAAATQGLLDPDHHLYHYTIRGMAENRDIWI
jgi:hypothetical protein